MGCALEPGTYFRNGWNILNCISLGSSLLLYTKPKATANSILSVLRMTRPVRLIQVFPELRLMFNALVKTMKEVS
jgi:hypothetical protein